MPATGMCRRTVVRTEAGRMMTPGNRGPALSSRAGPVTGRAPVAPAAMGSSPCRGAIPGPAARGTPRGRRVTVAPRRPPRRRCRGPRSGTTGIRRRSTPKRPGAVPDPRWTVGPRLTAGRDRTVGRARSRAAPRQGRARPRRPGRGRGIRPATAVRAHRLIRRGDRPPTPRPGPATERPGHRAPTPGGEQRPAGHRRGRPAADRRGPGPVRTGPPAGGVRGGW